MKQRLLVINLTCLFATAFALTTFLHELAHALTANILGIESTLFHSYVSYDDDQVSKTHQMLIAANGPLFSLLQAVICFVLIRKRKSADFGGIFLWWMAVIGTVVFLGYVMMGPFIPYGDTGKVYALLSIPPAVTLPLMGLAIFAIILFFKKATPLLKEMLVTIKTALNLNGQQAFIQLFFIPVVIGTFLNLGNSLPAPTPISLALPVVVSLTMIPSAIRLGKNEWTDSGSVFKFSLGSYWPIASMILSTIVLRFLASGLTL
ncbi:hypothetical protein [Marinoscillum sp. MHG1-6]|uniref:hypothetical protein n=1 Tax=Marinoscillum sp. MHG1-6 TaxID=2959627 RepID=UPI0021586B3C|nr:hypothetical protein [Marinoscillum sp. MHG1-6]